MRSQPHILLAAAAGLAVGHLLAPDNPYPNWQLVAMAEAASMLPDVDQYWAPEEKPQRGTLQDWLIAHRGPTHSLLATAVLYLGILALGRPDLAFAAVVGYLSHLLLDWLNYEGVPWLWPLPVRFRALPYGARLPSGAAIEVPLALLALGLAARWSGVLYVLPF